MFNPTFHDIFYVCNKVYYWLMPILILVGRLIFGNFNRQIASEEKTCENETSQNFMEKNPCYVVSVFPGKSLFHLRFSNE